MSKPLQISPDTAIKLSKQLNVPIERLMHMPRHILLQKLAELAKSESEPASEEAASAKPAEEDPSQQ
ncbi:YycC family protein [Paenibacillus sp. LHD-117]|uniref:YycC family protein n=1 Tax=Paenibacillus sp. LHD-117 TaxID=3071412 RepID=UPI0027E18297|nr:YycC family protein [Paenibacillus sp. LHD-117]MDQ6420315.1 YycC family protein [Paenibacillus sp. LHD-117]